MGSPLRIASYNIRSAKYDGDDKRKWSVRAAGVAADILKVNPGIVAIQEASPARVRRRCGRPRACRPR